MFNRRDANTGDRPSPTTERSSLTSSDALPTTPLSSPTPPPQAPPQPVVAQAPAPAPNSSRDGDESLVAREDTFEGSLRTTRGVRIMGMVQGTIESAQYVHIEEQANVAADITAAEVVIAGEYTGTLTCRQRVEIRATGRVSGRIETEKLLLHEGGYFDGELHMQKQKGDNAPAAKPDTGDSATRRLRNVELGSDTPKSRDGGGSAGASS